MNTKSGLIAFFLSFIPGLGHFYLNHYIRATIYGLGFWGFLAGGIGLGFIFGDNDVIIVAVLFALLLAGINLFDMVIHLLRRSPLQPEGSSVSAWVANPDGQGNRAWAASEEATGGTWPGGSGASVPSAFGGQPGSPAEQENQRFFVILLSFIPGLGHFQLGLMMRGLSFLISFFGLLTLIFFLTLLSHSEIFIGFLGILPIIWLFCMFDAIQLLQRKHHGEQLTDRTFLEDLNLQREDGRKSKVLAMFLAILPGAGHMYLGLQRRGFQLMAGFIFSIYILDVMRLSLFLFIIPLIWFFSFFDTLQQVARYNAGEIKDQPVVHWLANRQRWIGVGLLLLGMYYLFVEMALPIIEQMWPELHLSYWINHYSQTVILSIILIGGGIKLAFARRAAAREEGAEKESMPDDEG